MRKVKTVGVHLADKNNQVISLVTTGASAPLYRREVCEECPWRVDRSGAFPAEAFRFSARTCVDMAGSTFACHMSGKKKPTTCAGFLLSDSAYHNMLVRLARMRGHMLPDKIRRTIETFSTYREMAEANGVDPHDDALDETR